MKKLRLTTTNHTKIVGLGDIKFDSETAFMLLNTKLKKFEYIKDVNNNTLR